MAGPTVVKNKEVAFGPETESKGAKMSALEY